MKMKIEFDRAYSLVHISVLYKLYVAQNYFDGILIHSILKIFIIISSLLV